MGHEIDKHDNVLLVKERAWHGLGVVVPDAVRPTEALPLIGAEWGVRQLKLKAFDDDGTEFVLDDYLLNVRSDLVSNEGKLGVVSSGYQVFSNYQVAEFCEALGTLNEEGLSNVKVETVGTIRNGKKVWFLLKGEEFQVAKGDAIFPYLLVSNGHDGVTGLRVTPTTIRVVCSNTLHAVIGWDGAGSQTKAQSAAIAVEHIGDLTAKIEAAKLAIASYGNAMNDTRKYMEFLASKEINVKKLAHFFAENYNRDFRPVDMSSEEKKQKKRLRARHGGTR